MGKLKRIPFFFELDKFDYNKMYLSILGLFLPNKLTAKEIDVLSMFVTVSGKMDVDDCFNSYSRKIVKEKLGISSAGLHNHLKSIIDKGYLCENENGMLVIKDYLKPENDGTEFNIKMIRK